MRVISGVLIGGLLVTLAGCGTSTPTQAVPATRAPGETPGTPQPARDPTERPALQRGPAHPDRATIIDGSWLIGSDYPPALYLVPTGVSRCHWRVVDYASGTLIEEGRYAGPGPAAIWVGDGDLFQSEGCLLWQGYPQLTGSRDSSVLQAPSGEPTIEDGEWLIGTDVPAGRYRSDRRGTGACSYQVDRAQERDDESYESTGTVRSIPAYLDLNLRAGEVFTTRECGGWRLVE